MQKLIRMGDKKKMTKEELKEQDIRLNKMCFDYQEKEKRIEELEEKISVLLSCKNCPENKGGFICAKEYENKCLAQKIEYIKELQEENAELKEQCSILADCNSCTSSCKTENLEMKKQLSKAKEIIKELVRVEYADFTNGDYSNELSKVLEQAEQFLNSEGK